MLLKAEFEAKDSEELDLIEDDLLDALIFYSENNPDTSSQIEKYPHENKIIIKILKMDEQSN